MTKRWRRSASALEGSAVELGPSGEAVVLAEDGRRVLVPGLVPGERAVIGVEPGGRVARGRVERLLDASDQRVEPPCPHAQRCGGCDWMHLSAAARREAYRRRLERLLEGGGLSAPARIEVVSPCAPEGYRSRARLFVERRGGRARVGYRSPRSRRLAEVDACLVLRPELAPVVRELAEILAPSEGAGDALVALGRGGARVLELRWTGELSGQSVAQVDALVASGAWAGARLWPEDAVAPLVFGDPRARVPALDGGDVIIAAGGFAQASHEGGLALARRVDEAVGVEPGGLVELFAGSGTFSVAIAARAARYQAVEQSAAAAEQLRENLASRGLAGKVTCADANAFRIPRRTDTVVLDPPRSGAAGACEAIVRARPARVIYVSCEPVTLVRDVGSLLAGGYVLQRLELLELFPHTSHVEALATLARTG